jgi:hypothetical protein
VAATSHQPWPSLPPESRENGVRLNQLSAIRLVDSALEFANQFLAPQVPDIVALYDPLSEGAPFIQRQLRGFSFEFFNRHSAKNSCLLPAFKKDWCTREGSNLKPSDP